MSFRRLLPALVAAGVGSQAFAADAPSPTASPPPCTVVLGGTGTLTGDAKLDGVWKQINTAVTEGLVAELRQQQYKIETLYPTATDAQAKFTEVMLTMQLHDCGQALQVTHTLASASASERSVGFDILLFHVTEDGENNADGKRTGVVAADFEREYRYALDEAFLKRSLSQLGASYARDVIGSGRLPRAVDPAPEGAPIVPGSLEEK